MTENEIRDFVDVVLKYAGYEGPVTVDFDPRFSGVGIDARTQFTDPPIITFARDLTAEEYMVSAIHEVAHLVAYDDTHEHRFQEQFRQLTSPEALAKMGAA